MSRLDDECIVAIVRNRSGIDAGEIDYSLSIERFENQDLGSLKDIIETLNILQEKCRERIGHLNKTEN